MQHGKLIAVAGGSFALGAVVSWVFTTAHHEKKRKASEAVLDRVMRRQDAEIRQLRTMVTDRTPAEYEQMVMDGRVTRIATGVRLEGSGVVDEIDGSPVDIPEGSGVDTSVEAESENSPEGDSVESSEEEDRYVEGEPEERTTTRLEGLIERYAANPDDVDQFVHASKKALKYAHETPPFVISMADYAAGEVGDDEYAKITLKYFPVERILLDDEEEPIEAPDVDAMVGWRNLSGSWGGESGDPDVVFVRNDRLRTDFEVVQEHDDPPIHVRYGMSKDVFEANKVAGNIRFKEEDSD